MILALRYFFIVCLFGLLLLIFTLYVNFHVFLSYFLCYICKELEEPASIYDYIIVGSGTAGSVVTLRLSEEANNKILLLEAGPYSNFLFDIPAITPLLQKTVIDWQYATTPQKYACKAMKNNASYWPMGKLFGGTHKLNNMIYVRGHKNDYEEWFKDKIDYNYEQDILEYYKKTEQWFSDINSSDGNYKSPVRINNLKFVTKLSNSILKAAKALGFPIKKFKNKYGFRKPYVTTHKNKRWTTSDSLLSRNPENLKIITNAFVTKIMLKNNFEAYAVKFDHLGVSKIIRARKGVILSAGVIGTPKLLLLSGIGPKKHLETVKIKPRINLPVGDNLQDHVTTGFDLIILNESLTVNIEALVSPLSAYKYFVSSGGPWMSVGCEAIGFCHTNGNTNVPLIAPNLQFMILNVGVSSDGGKHIKNVLGFKNEIWDSYFSNFVGKQVISILPIVLHPKSSGYVRLKNSNSNTLPLINPNYLKNENDVNILLEGIKIIRNLINTKAMKKLGAQLNQKLFPQCENFTFNSEQYWRCYVKQLTLTTFHPCCTCKMGHKSNLTTVVDYDFQVKNTNKLFIVDASVLPGLPSGNPNAVIAMMAEKAADAIKYIAYLNKGNCQIIEIFVVRNVCLLLKY